MSKTKIGFSSHTRTISVTTPSNYKVLVRVTNGWVVKGLVTTYSPTSILRVDVKKRDYYKQGYLPDIEYINKDRGGNAYCTYSLEKLFSSAVAEERAGKVTKNSRNVILETITILAEVEEAVQSVKDKMPYYNEYK